MNAGRVFVGGILVIPVVAGFAMYYLQTTAYYEPVAFTPGAEIELTTIVSGQPEPIVVNDVQGIDANSSPLRFRACFKTPMTVGMLTETYQSYPGAEPLVAPDWFDCFDAKAIDAALEQGQALAFLSRANITYGIDRVVAVFPDGRAFAWHQLNECGAQVFDGKAPPEGCPPPPVLPKE